MNKKNPVKNFLVIFGEKIYNKRMNYDFTTLPNRRGQPSIKWRGMLDEADVPQGIIPLTVADMEFAMAPEIIDGLHRHINEMIFGYTYPNADFISAVQHWMKTRHAFDVKPEWIALTTGVVPAFFTAIKALSKKGDRIVIMPPVYPPFFMAVERQKRNLIECPLIKNKDGFYEIDFDLFSNICKTKKPKILLFCSPHNPVGRVWKKNELEKLAEICLKHHVFILADEIHHDIVMPGHTHTVLQTLSPEVARNTITHTSLSKTFNLAGMMLNVNFISDKKVRDAFNAELDKQGLHICTALGFKAYEIAYTSCAAWLDELLTVIDTNQKLVTSSLTDTKVQAAPIEGTYLQWLNFRKLHLNDADLTRFLQEKALLYVNDGYTFGKTGSGFARLNLAAPTAKIQEAVTRLKQALKELKEK